ncbi:MAG: hypothetical protein F4Z92_02645 [Gemmatimonadetes bacterium]|nr:hypothetical protein [Gemmatimonadota bacterium]
MPNRGVEAIATRELDSLRFAWRVRCVRRIAQRPATLRIDEIEEIVAWKDGGRANAREAEAVFVAVSHGLPSDTADARGVWPLAAVLAALDAFGKGNDSLSRSVVLTLGAVPRWDILDASAPDDTVASALHTEYRNLLEARADSGPSPPLARPRQPGVLIGLIAQSDLPVLSHNPRNRMLAGRSVFGHDAWNVPDGVSLRTAGDMLVLGVANGVSPDDDEVLSHLTDVVLQALETVDGWTGPGRPPSVLAFDPQTISWLLGIVLPVLFLGVGTWSILAKSLINLGNAKRALRYTQAEVVSHLLWHKRTGRRKRKAIAHTNRGIARASRKIDRAQRLHVQLEERIRRLDRAPASDNSSAAKTKRAAFRQRQVKRRKKALEGRAEVLNGHLQGMNDHLELLERHLASLNKARTRADTEATKARRVLPAFPCYLRHARGSDPGAPDNLHGVGKPDGVADANAGDRGDANAVIRRLVSSTRATRLWLRVHRVWHWIGRVLRIGSAPAIAQPGDRSPEFIAEMNRLASCLVCYRQHYDARRDILKKRGQDIVGGVWNGVWRAITQSRGLAAFVAGAGSVIAALVLPGVAEQLAADTVAERESISGLSTAVELALPLGVVGGAYWWFRGYEHGRAMVWGAAALTMLGLTTIEFTALEADLADVFDSQRVTVMQLVIVAMLFIGQEFGNRAAIDRKHELTDEQKEFAELLRQAKLDLSECLGKVPQLRGVPDAACGDFKSSVKQTGTRFTNPKNGERRVVALVTALYMAVCVHFVAPAMSWDGLWPSGVLVHGDALNVAAVASTVVLLPVFSLWSAWMETKEEADG